MSWRLRRVRELARLVNGYPFDAQLFSNDAEVPLVRIRDLSSTEFETYVPASAVPPAAEICDGDVLVGMDGDFNVRFWDRGRAALNQRVCLLRATSDTDSRFLAYALPPHLKRINDLTYSTTVKHLSSRDVLGIRMQAPDLPAQRAIADFLDRETAQIDTLIAKQQRLIATLRERRSAVVMREALGGTPMAIDAWLARVPTSWSISRVARLGKLVTGGTPAGGAEVSERADENAVEWIRPEDLGSRDVRGTYVRAQGASSLPIVPPGATLVCGIGASLGKVGMANRPVTTNQQITAWVHQLNHGFAYYGMLAFGDLLRANAAKSTLPILNSTRLGAIEFPVPPSEEQSAIARRLDAQVSHIDTLIQKSERLIELSQERRAALITAAVTGQIDVRKAA